VIWVQLVFVFRTFFGIKYSRSKCLRLTIFKYHFSYLCLLSIRKNHHKLAKPFVPKGTRDFLPTEVNKRKYIFNIIEEVFRKYGFLPIETPAMEALETLTGKYGEEGDKLLFKILNNGDFMADTDEAILAKKDSYALVKSIAKKGLRYDLTVPFARFVVMHQNDIQFPFKRYQIQPVWRGDRPAKGRYQEFFQCDVDVVGSESLMYEAELVSIYHDIFNKLGVSVKILINNRKILFGLAEAAGIPDKFIDMTVAIDKLDKIGEEGVTKDMVDRGISEAASVKILAMLKVKSIEELMPYFDNSAEGKKGIEELQQVYTFLDQSEIDNLVFDVSLARGLSYYTGCIFEVKVDTTKHTEIAMGSIGGGGRYDNLTGTFGLPGVSGVGVSLGAERIYDVLEELNLFPSNVNQASRIIFLTFDDLSLKQAFVYGQLLRKNGIACDVYPDAKQMKKQMKYANDRGMEYAAIIGESELKDNVISLKNMISGEQKNVRIDELITLLK
jgi:histidyl-tRNA synthetase